MSTPPALAVVHGLVEEVVAWFEDSGAPLTAEQVALVATLTEAS